MIDRDPSNTTTDCQVSQCVLTWNFKKHDVEKCWYAWMGLIQRTLLVPVTLIHLLLYYRNASNNEINFISPRVLKTLKTVKVL